MRTLMHPTRTLMHRRPPPRQLGSSNCPPLHPATPPRGRHWRVATPTPAAADSAALYPHPLSLRRCIDKHRLSTQTPGPRVGPAACRPTPANLPSYSCNAGAQAPGSGHLYLDRTNIGTDPR